MIKNFARSFFLILLFSNISSCSKDISKYGKITTYDAANQGHGSFVFFVDDEFIEKNEKSKPDKKFPIMSKAEAKLLVKLLEKNKYCINEEGDLSFAVLSRQEKIYDVTFANLIEQNYKARPVAPRMYHGKCL